MIRSRTMLTWFVCLIAMSQAKACDDGDVAAKSLARELASDAAGRDDPAALEASHCWTTEADLDIDRAILVDVRSAAARAELLISSSLHGRMGDRQIYAMFAGRPVVLFGNGKDDHLLVAACEAHRRAGSNNAFVLKGGMRTIAATGKQLQGSASVLHELAVLDADELRSLALSTKPLIYAAGGSQPAQRWSDVLELNVQEWTNDSLHRPQIESPIGVVVIVILPAGSDLDRWRDLHELDDRNDVLYYGAGIDAYVASERQALAIAENAYKPLPSGCRG